MKRINPCLLPESYFLRADGAPHVDELIDAVGPVSRGDGLAIEIGGGRSNYRPYLHELGYSYLAVEPARCLRFYFEANAIEAICSTLENAELPPCQLMLFAHSLEHVDNLERCLMKAFVSLVPKASLYIVVPYGSDDLCNPDHNWFFTPGSLGFVLEMFGFQIEAMTVKQIVQHERFIYCKATK
jgi:hypothetical protein